MSKRNKIIILFFILVSLGCIKYPCKCDFNPTEFIECRIVGQQGQNLILGSSSIFHPDSIKILQKRNDFNFHHASVSKGIVDSTALRLDFYIPAGKSYIYYNNATALDSLEIKWKTQQGKCCGERVDYSSVEAVEFNKTFVAPVNGIYTFRK